MNNKKYIIVITPDGIVLAMTFNPEDPLDFLQNIVGGNIETAPTELDNFCMLVNEEGKLLDLPFNAKATAILPRGTADYISGTAVLMKKGAEDLEPMTHEETVRWRKIIQEEYKY